MSSSRTNNPQHDDHADNAPDQYRDREGAGSDGDAEATAPDTDVETAPSLEDQLTSLAEENCQLLDSLKRERAAFINYRQRAEEEKTLIRRYGAQDFAFDLLNVLDYFEASLNFESCHSDAESVIQGVKFTVDEFRRILDKHGIKEIRTDIAFDPCMHEAFGTEITDEAEPGTILMVHRKGYMYKDRVLRAAMVTVAKACEESDEPDDENQTEIGNA